MNFQKHIQVPITSSQGKRLHNELELYKTRSKWKMRRHGVLRNWSCTESHLSSIGRGKLRPPYTWQRKWPKSVVTSIQGCPPQWFPAQTFLTQVRVMYFHLRHEESLTLSAKQHQILSEAGLASNKGFLSLAHFPELKNCWGGWRGTVNVKTSEVKAPCNHRILWNCFETFSLFLVAGVCSSLSSLMSFL